VRFLRVPVGRLEERRRGEAKRGEASRAGVVGEREYIESRLMAEERGGAGRLSDDEGGSKRPTSSKRGVLWKGAPKSSPSAMRGLKSEGKSSFLIPGVERKSSKGDSIGEVKYSFCLEESPAWRRERIAWAACSSEELEGREAAGLRLTTSEVGFSSIVRYSEQSEEKASLSGDWDMSSDDEVRWVTVRGVGGKKVGIPWWAAKSLTLWKTGWWEEVVGEPFKVDEDWEDLSEVCKPLGWLGTEFGRVWRSFKGKVDTCCRWEVR
jgi:hypothetical protein